MGIPYQLSGEGGEVGQVRVRARTHEIVQVRVRVRARTHAIVFVEVLDRAR